MDNDLTIQLRILSSGVEKINGATNAVNNLNKSTQTASSKMSNFGKVLESTGSRINVLGQRMTGMITLPLIMFANSAINTALDVDKAWVRMRKVFDGTEEDLAGLKEAAWDMSTTFGITFEESADALVEFSKAGITSKEELAALGKITAETSILFDSNMNEALTGVKSIMFGFGLTVEQTAQELAAINTISDQTTASEKGVMEMLSKVAGTARAAGFSIREVAAAQAVFEANAIPAGRAGNAMKSILTSLIKQSNLAKDQFKELGVSMSDLEWKTSSGSEKLEKLAKKLAEIKKIGDKEALKKFNEQVGDMSEALGDMDEGPIEKLQLLKASLVEAEVTGDKVRMDSISKELESLNIGGKDASENIEIMIGRLKDLEATGRTVELDQANEALSSLVGKFQINNLNVLLQDLAKQFDDNEKTVSIFYDALSKGEKDLVNATFKTKQLEEVMNSSSVKVARLEQAYKKQASVLGDQLLPYKVKLLEFLTGIIDKFNKLSPKTREWIIKIGGLVAVIGPLLAFIGLMVTGLGFLVTAFNPITLALIAVGIGFAALTVLWIKNWENIQERTLHYLGKIKTYIEDHWDEIKGIFEGFWISIKSAFDLGWGVLKGAYEVAMGIFTGDWDLAWNGVKTIFSSIFIGESGNGGLVGVLQGAMLTMESIVSSSSDVIVDTYDNMSTLTQGIFIGLGIYFTAWWLARKLETLYLIGLYTVDWVIALGKFVSSSIASFTTVGAAAIGLQAILAALAFPFVIVVGVASIIAAIKVARDLAEAMNEATDSNDRNVESIEKLIEHANSIKETDHDKYIEEMQKASDLYQQEADIQSDLAESAGFFNSLKNGLGFNNGGVVYAANGFFPKGKDTVPAMLTPGEMVLNSGQQANLFNMLSGKTQTATAGGPSVTINVGNMIASKGEQRAFAREIEKLLEEDTNRQ